MARQAEARGYSLVLAQNTEGKVSFVLSGPLRPDVKPPAAACTVRLHAQRRIRSGAHYLKYHLMYNLAIIVYDMIRYENKIVPIISYA